MIGLPQYLSEGAIAPGMAECGGCNACGACAACALCPGVTGALASATSLLLCTLYVVSPQEP